ARQAERDRIPEEDFRERLPDHDADAAAVNRLWRVLARGAAAEIRLHDHDGGARIGRIRRGVFGELGAVVLEQVVLQALERDGLEEPRGDDAVGVDVVAAQWQPRTSNLTDALNGQ